MADYLLAYDIDTSTQSGQRRLRHVARLCQGYGLRVQYSVFELTLEPQQLLIFIAKLQALMTDGVDSARVYKFIEPALVLGRRRSDESSRGALVW